MRPRLAIKIRKSRLYEHLTPGAVTRNTHPHIALIACSTLKYRVLPSLRITNHQKQGIFGRGNRVRDKFHVVKLKTHKAPSDYFVKSLRGNTSNQSTLTHLAFD